VSALVVALGHPDRGDDAVGRMVADQLRVDPPADCAITDVTNPLDLLDTWAGVDVVVLVDAMDGGGAPGTVSVLADDALESIPAASGTHDLGLADVLAMADSLHRRPARLAVVGIQAATLELGAPVSAAVLDAVPVAAAVVRELLHPDRAVDGGFRL
jgi:hydrogenase maturation protease